MTLSKDDPTNPFVRAELWHRIDELDSVQGNSKIPREQQASYLECEDAQEWDALDSEMDMDKEVQV